MQKQTSIYIPKPCHEDWNKMTPTQQGKFCGSCSKQVIDFSLMSDNQILKLLSNQSGKLCGRFDAAQLQRQLVETKIKKKKSLWMALAMPLLFLFDRSEAQHIKMMSDTTLAAPPKKDITNVLIGKVAICKPVKPASLIDTTVSVSNVGYTAAEKQVSLKRNDTEAVIKLEPASTGDVVVMGYAIQKLQGRVGGVSICRKVTWGEKTDSVIRKSLRIPGFKIYPNPTTKSSTINLQIKNPGSYQTQLLNNQSALIQTEEINVETKNTITSIQLPSNIAAGIYYLRLIDEQTKKSYVEKLVLQ